MKHRKKVKNGGMPSPYRGLPIEWSFKPTIHCVMNMNYDARIKLDKYGISAS